MRRFLWVTGLLVTVLFLVLGITRLNSYLKATNRWFYATGTNEKAFLNATWKMSPQEIERANRTQLAKDEDDSAEIIGRPSVVDSKRYKELVQNNISLWGFSVAVHYEFFDEKLKGYYLELKTYNVSTPFDDALATLTQEFGAGKRNPAANPSILQDFTWETNNQQLSLTMAKEEFGAKNGYNIGVRATYKAMEKEIEDIIANEKKKYF